MRAKKVATNYNADSNKSQRGTSGAVLAMGESGSEGYEIQQYVVQILECAPHF